MSPSNEPGRRGGGRRRPPRARCRVAGARARRRAFRRSDRGPSRGIPCAARARPRPRPSRWRRRARDLRVLRPRCRRGTGASARPARTRGGARSGRTSGRAARRARSRAAVARSSRPRPESKLTPWISTTSSRPSRRLPGPTPPMVRSSRPSFPPSPPWECASTSARSRPVRSGAGSLCARTGSRSPIVPSCGTRCRSPLCVSWPTSSRAHRATSSHGSPRRRISTRSRATSTPGAAEAMKQGTVAVEGLMAEVEATHKVELG